MRIILAGVISFLKTSSHWFDQKYSHHSLAIFDVPIDDLLTLLEEEPRVIMPETRLNRLEHLLSETLFYFEHGRQENYLRLDLYIYSLMIALVLGGRTVSSHLLERYKTSHERYSGKSTSYPCV